jgi:hypothetical protein
MKKILILFIMFFSYNIQANELANQQIYKTILQFSQINKTVNIYSFKKIQPNEFRFIGSQKPELKIINNETIFYINNSNSIHYKNYVIEPHAGTVFINDAGMGLKNIATIDERYNTIYYDNK